MNVSFNIKYNILFVSTLLFFGCASIFMIKEEIQPHNYFIIHLKQNIYFVTILLYENTSPSDMQKSTLLYKASEFALKKNCNFFSVESLCFKKPSLKMIKPDMEDFFTRQIKIFTNNKGSVGFLAFEIIIFNHAKNAPTNMDTINATEFISEYKKMVNKGERLNLDKYLYRYKDLLNMLEEL